MVDAYLVDGKRVELSAQDFLAQGGEGSVYVDDDRAYKIYKDPDRALTPNKHQELSVLDPDLFIKPEALVLDDDGRVVGYQMRLVPNAVPLCKLFSASYKNRNSIDQHMILSLIEQLRRGIEQAHAQQILIVDLNDQNFLTSADHSQLYFIDVDSYQTQTCPASAIMDSVRDWHTLGDDDDGPLSFSTKTDWFSFAIICFQLLTGIHPYRGKHPYVRDLIKRMKMAVSVFDPQVSIPRVCPPLSCIPQPLHDWLKSVLQDGGRSAPPDPLWVERGSVMSRMTTQEAHLEDLAQADDQTSPFVIHELARVKGLLRAHTYDHGHRALIADHEVYLNQERVNVSLEHPVAVLFEAYTHRAVVVNYDQHEVTLIDAQTGERLGAPIPAEQMSHDDHTLHLISQGQHREVMIRGAGERLIPITKSASKVMPHATQLFRGGLLQNMLGKYVFTALESGSELSTIRLPELDGHTIIDAYYTRHVLTVKWRERSDTTMGRFRFKVQRHGAQRYSFDQIDHAELDRCELIVTPQKVGVWLRANGDVTLFHASPGAIQARIIPRALRGDELLALEGDRVVMMRRGVISAVTLSG